MTRLALTVPRAMLGAGPSVCYLLAFVVRGGKTDENGRPTYLGCIRNQDPLLCAHNALALYLCLRFNILQEEFPDVNDRDAFFGTPLFPGTKPGRNVTYHQMYQQLK